MTKKIKIFDTTLRDGEQSPGCSMNLAEKLEMARQLDKLGVDVIEAGFSISSPEDFRAVEAIAKIVENCTVASLARCGKEDIDAAYHSVKHAKHPRIHVFVATSDIHLQYKLKMTREQVLSDIDKMVRYAKSLCDDVEFSAEDASRTERAFLAKAVQTAIAAGANVINVPDTVGYAVPQEMYDIITYLRSNVPGIENVEISVHCHDDLGLAVANSLAAIMAGATQVECAVNGIGERAGNASLEEIVMAFKTRRDYYGVECNIDTKQIYRTSKLLSAITGVPIAPNKSIVGDNAFAHEAGIHQHGVLSNPMTYEIMRSTDVGIPQNKLVLGKHSGKHALADRLSSMGYEISKEALAKVFEQFKILADKKKTVTDKDIEALVISEKSMVVPVYEIVSHMVNTGNSITNTACIKLKKDDDIIEAVSIGTAPIDAAFKAIDSITKIDVSLESYSINAVTDGEDAMGEAIVRLGHNGQLFAGRGLSTDIIESSIMAYVAGINKILSQ